ncbi:hypothetical protein IPL85_04820 [Candidatus Saccharibacteria bacterium]|nr:MAG: hypothetical protein IPL85_04820 [Candidatus Saccharibacteria bacterium]
MDNSGEFLVAGQPYFLVFRGKRIPDLLVPYVEIVDGTTIRRPEIGHGLNPLAYLSSSAVGGSNVFTKDGPRI